MKRKEFLRTATSAFVLLASGEIVKANDLLFDDARRRKIKLRFAVASDGHYGEKNTAYEAYFSTAVSAINATHATSPLAFCVINGDIVHDDKTLYPSAKKALDNLSMKYYVSQGNHDHVTPEEWQSIWGMPVNHDFVVDKNSFLIGTTSNVQGEYLCPDLQWFSQKLEEHKAQQHVFIFLHINPGKLSTHAVECPEFFELLSRYKNVKAVFNGHDHDEENIKTRDGIPFLYDAHFGGSWGTSYRGFRIVELLKDNSVLTYIMNPTEKINSATLA